MPRSDDGNGISVLSMLIKTQDQHGQHLTAHDNRFTHLEISVATLKTKVALYAALGATAGGSLVAAVVSYLFK